MAKSRQQYLKEQAAKLPPAQQRAALTQINAAQKSGGISKAELTKLDSQFNTTLYGQTGLGGTAGPAPWMQTSAPTPTGPVMAPDIYAAGREAERKSAFTLLQDTFKQYNLESLAPVIQQFMIEGIPAEEAAFRLRDTDVYKQRFSGNQGRIAKGLAAYNPAEYLQAEETYQNLLKSNNLSGLANKATTDKLISGAVSPLEAQDRINKVFNKIDNASAEVKNELGRYFSQYGVGDTNIQRNQIAEAILSGEDPAMKLESGIRKAQLRAGATAAGFNLAETRVQTIESLLKEAGVSDAYAAGQQGFQTLAQIEPSTQTLAERYGGPTVSASELEKEAFLGLKSERRRKLQEQEQATFKGSAGTTQVSLAQQGTGTF
jgi:hypothetical protein